MSVILGHVVWVVIVKCLKKGLNKPPEYDDQANVLEINLTTASFLSTKTFSLKDKRGFS